MTRVGIDDHEGMPTISARKWVRGPVELTSDDERPVLVQPWATAVEERFASAGTFGAFLKLGRATDREIAAFANRAGLLGLCRHGEPRGRCHEVMRRAGVRGDIERVSHWRRWAIRLAAVVEVGKVLRAGGIPSESLVDQLVGGLRHVDGDAAREALLRSSTGADAVAPEKLDALARRWWFCRFVNQLLTMQAVIVPGTERNPRLAMEYGPGSLIGTLTLQAALAAAGTLSLVICANCRRPFRPTRRRQANRRAYCLNPECQAAAQRDASRDYRSRLRERKSERKSRAGRHRERRATSSKGRRL